MQPHFFYKFSAAGNTTLFLPVKNLADARPVDLVSAMGRDGISAEQAAFADIENRRLRMAGGEFCANACRSLGALLDLHASVEDPKSPRHYEISIAGYCGKIQLELTGHSPCWEIAATFRLEEADCKNDGNLFFLPGISHLLIQTDKLPQHREVPALAEALLSEFPANEPALGLVWWKRCPKGVEILPYVLVPGAGTAMIENACGSASIALAMALHEKGKDSSLQIAQPSGEKLSCAVAQDDCRISLGGLVRLCASGEVWIGMGGNNA